MIQKIDLITRRFKIIIIFTIALIISSSTTFAQAEIKDTVNLPTAVIEDDLNTSKYLYHLLKTNGEYFSSDTVYHYTIDFSIEIPDTNYYEKFVGIVCVEVVDDKPTVYICDGEYSDSYDLNINFSNWSFDNIFYKTGDFKYRKFKRRTEIEYKGVESAFKVQYGSKVKSYENIYMFSNKVLSSIDTKSLISKSVLGHTYFIDRSYKKYVFSDSILYLSNYEFSCISNTTRKDSCGSYDYNNMEVIYSFSFNIVEENGFKKKKKLDMETPKSIYRKLEGE